MTDLANPLSRRAAARLRRRAAMLALNTAIALLCAGLALAATWHAAHFATGWADAALGWTGGGAFAAFALVQIAPLVRAFIRSDLE